MTRKRIDHGKWLIMRLIKVISLISVLIPRPLLKKRLFYNSIYFAEKDSIIFKNGLSPENPLDELLWRRNLKNLVSRKLFD